MNIDLTSGKRAQWKGKDTADWLFLDRRKEMNPDIVASNEFLPFKDATFERADYDPPHIYAHSRTARERVGNVGVSKYNRYYTVWTNRDVFIRNIIRVAKEAARVLKPAGIIHVKHSEGDTTCTIPFRSVHEILATEQFEITSKIISRAKSMWGKNQTMITHADFARK